MRFIRKVRFAYFCMVVLTLACAPPLEEGAGLGEEVEAQKPKIEVTPQKGFVSDGEQGGPFAPETFDYTVTNIHADPIRWSAANQAGWLFLSRNGGRLEPGQSAKVTVEVNRNAERLASGEHEDHIIFFGETEENQIAKRVVSLVVDQSTGKDTSADSDSPVKSLSNEPILQVDTDRLVFDDAASEQSFTMENAGSKGIEFDILSRDEWIRVDPAQGSFQEQQAITVTLSADNLHTGLYQSAVDIDAGKAGTFSVKVIFEALDGEITLSPQDDFRFEALQSGQDQQKNKHYEIINTGDRPIDWEATKTQSWVALSSGSGTLNPGDTEELRVSINDESAGLGPGVYHDTVYLKADAVKAVSLDIVLTVGRGQLAVEPDNVFRSHGIQGGVLQPSRQSYTLFNEGQGYIDWQVSATKPWLSLSRTQGTLEPEENDQIQVSIDSEDPLLDEPGIHTANIFFDGGEAGSVSLPVILMVEEALVPLKVTPSSSLLGSGQKGGPFNPSSQEYVLHNDGEVPMDWSAFVDKDWVNISETEGTLQENESRSLAISFNEKASSLPVGTHQAVISFRKTAPKESSITRSAILNITENQDSEQPSDESKVGTDSSMATARRTSGIAPLGVLFDATDSSSGVVQPEDDYASMHYEWDFGDDSAGTYSTTGMSRNKATGCVAAHVYEQPGNYEVLLKVTDTQGYVHHYWQTISVSEFEGTTYYVSSSEGADTNSGRSRSEPLRSYNKALDMAGPDVRILFKRGDQWSISGWKMVSASGPVILGAYGTGPLPRIKVTDSNSALDLRADNWRVMDLEFVGPGDISNEAGFAGGHLTNNLALRLKISQFEVGISYGWNGAKKHSDNIIADCTLTDNIMNNGYVGGRYIALLGNHMERAGVSHVLRVWHMRWGVISNNIVLDPGGDRLAMKFHNEQGLNLPYSKFAVISDNRFRGHVFVVSIAPQWWGADERIKDVVFERNLLQSMPDTQAGMLVQAQRVTIRNNLIDGTGASEWYSGIEASASPIPGANLDHIYNNTIYRLDDGEEFTAVAISEGAYEVTVRNNLAYAPNTLNAVMVKGAAVKLASDHNMLSDAPGFINPQGGDFELNGDSPAIDAGVFSPYVRDDYDADRRLDTRPDMGAFEY